MQIAKKNCSNKFKLWLTEQQKIGKHSEILHRQHTCNGELIQICRLIGHFYIDCPN